MVQAQPRTQPRTRPQRIEAAIDHALHGRWDLAAVANRALLQERPNDLEAANRLGKALTELGDLQSAAGAYRKSLELDPWNTIAKRNLARIEESLGAGAKSGKRGKPAKAAKPGKTTGTVRVESLIEESAKSASFPLLRPNLEVLSDLDTGDTVELIAGEKGLIVQTEDGDTIGAIDRHAGSRLGRLITGGNRYEAVLREVTETGAIVHIRETYRHPSLLDQASFQPPTKDKRKSTPRAYTRSSLVRRDTDSPTSSDDEPDDADDWGTDEEADELAEEGFTATNVDDEIVDEDLEGELDDEDVGDSDDTEDEDES